MGKEWEVKTQDVIKNKANTFKCNIIILNDIL
jgi:hypothetical protein